MFYEAVFIGAHPDDVVIACGGTIIELKRKGLRCLIVSLSSGSYGKPEVAALRERELARSCELLNVDYQIIGMVDTEIQSDVESVALAYDLLSQNNPRVIFTHNEHDLHPDHINGLKIVRRAVHQYIVRNEHEHKRLEWLAQYHPIRLSFDNFNSYSLNLSIDISEHVDLKREIISLHRSQKPFIDAHIQKVTALNRLLGSLIGVKAAEGYLLERIGTLPMGLNDIFPDDKGLVAVE
jgi:LmbE family N-acetylglucosaminyl deacetylase